MVAYMASTASGTPGFLINGVSLHPESVFLAKQKNPGLHVLVQLANLMPDFYYNAYGGQIAWIEHNHDMMVDAVAAMIEASRTIYKDEAKVVPIIMKATGRPKDAVEYAWKTLTDNCVWTVNTGYDAKRTAWTIQHDFDVGYIKKKPTVEQVFNPDIANEAVKKLGGPIKIGKCTQ